MARFQLERGPVPLHHQVYLDLRAALDNAEWRRGDGLPPERELATRYGCSLITVRRALDELKREGRLERIRGRGTFVTEPPIVRNISGPVSFADDVRSLGFEPYSEVLTARTEPASPRAAQALALAPGAAVHFLERIRGADGVPLLLEQARLPADRLPGLLDRDFSHGASLWDTLRGAYGLPVLRRQEVLSAVVPSEREARLLTLRARRPSIQFDGIAFTVGNMPIEFSRTVVSPERARYFVESSGDRVRSVTPLGPAEVLEVEALGDGAGPSDAAEGDAAEGEPA
jgi:GntR family transcriptional regulator